MVKGLLGARRQREHHGMLDGWETERQVALFWGRPETFSYDENKGILSLPHSTFFFCFAYNIVAMRWSGPRAWRVHASSNNQLRSRPQAPFSVSASS
ncbi:hypothetical protein NDU88_005933 [Pleurodeles waltl]|uniref:Uncharacterized protein n=1 Tax=Pleurodeles waltl TaxID=8319 RepID=A0AAV7SNA9_PLEWA|nr:hypothetical protein NDU88_005933 [Pleurodeles waltl]